MVRQYVTVAGKFVYTFCLCFFCLCLNNKVGSELISCIFAQSRLFVICGSIAQVYTCDNMLAQICTFFVIYSVGDGIAMLAVAIKFFADKVH